MEIFHIQKKYPQIKSQFQFAAIYKTFLKEHQVNVI
jgi:hypothetical protein